ncbi:MAG: hypothetical protein OEZ36_00665 [Spirochaetota bacterium]|nr:hypothetical protein [Spirochaetota bacterium]
MSGLYTQPYKRKMSSTGKIIAYVILIVVTIVGIRAFLDNTISDKGEISRLKQHDNENKTPTAGLSRLGSNESKSQDSNKLTPNPKEEDPRKRQAKTLITESTGDNKNQNHNHDLEKPEDIYPGEGADSPGDSEDNPVALRQNHPRTQDKTYPNTHRVKHNRDVIPGENPGYKKLSHRKIYRKRRRAKRAKRPKSGSELPLKNAPDSSTLLKKIQIQEKKLLPKYDIYGHEIKKK